MIAFRCSSCGQKFEVDDSLAGKKGRCKNCGERFAIPALAAKAPAAVRRTPAKPTGNPRPAPPAAPPAASSPFDDLEMPPAAGPVRAVEKGPRKKTKARSSSAARTGPFGTALRGATVGFFLVFFALAAPSVSLERRFVPGGSLSKLPFGAIPTDLGPVVSALACARLVAQVSAMLTAVLAVVSFAGTTLSYLRGNRAAFEGGSPWLNRGWYLCGVLTAAYLVFLGVHFGPAVSTPQASARSRHRRLPRTWFAGKPIDVEAALDDLKSYTEGTRQDALGRLARATVEPSRRAEVARSLEPLVTDENQWTRDDAVKALGVWGDHESVLVLLNALDQYAAKKWSRALLLESLERIKDPSCAERVAARLTDHDDMHQASDILVLLGEAGERPTWKYLDHPEFDVWYTAFGIIQEIGTDASIPVVRNILKGRDVNFQKARTARVTLEILGAPE